MFVKLQFVTGTCTYNLKANLSLKTVKLSESSFPCVPLPSEAVHLRAGRH